MKDEKDQYRGELKSDLEDELLNQVQGGMQECIFFCEPSCPKCQSMKLNYFFDTENGMMYVCTKCGYTGKRVEFPCVSLFKDQQE